MILHTGAALAFSSGLVAFAFLSKVHAAMTAETLAMVAARNCEAATGVDHLQDFCDANQLMLEAIQETVNKGTEPDLSDEVTGQLIDAAWALARQILHIQYGVNCHA